jgi:hypothetical protein
MTSSTGKKGKQSSGAPKSRAAAWYQAPNYVTSPRPFKLTKKQRAELLKIVVGQNLSDDKAAEFFGHIEFAIGLFIGSTEDFKSVKPNTIRRRLGFIQENLRKILTDKRKGLVNVDEVTNILLTDALSKEGLTFRSVRDAVVALHNAAVAARFGEFLPNRWKDYALRDLAHLIAIITRDCIGVEPRKSEKGIFARLVRESARLAGRRTVSREVIFNAIDQLNRENVVQTEEKVGMRGGKPQFRKIPVSHIRPFFPPGFDGQLTNS